MVSSVVFGTDLPSIGYFRYLIGPHWQIGRPMYAYHDGSAWQYHVVDDAGDVGYDVSPGLDTAGQPHLSYYDATYADLKVAFQTPLKCWSGCGPTAWGRLFGWADHQAAHGNAYWAGRWGLYRVAGGHGGDAVQPPAPWTTVLLYHDVSYCQVQARSPSDLFADDLVLLRSPVASSAG